eukprot:m.26870 g.26870  ORF g.26870 m.26870 type:complete len:51 (+) comp29568_c0_seq1:141-293(+)
MCSIFSGNAVLLDFNCYFLQQLMNIPAQVPIQFDRAPKASEPDRHTLKRG